MKKKKTLRYAVMAILILTVGILMQYGIRWTTGFFSGQIREKFSRPPETEPVTAPEEEGQFHPYPGGGNGRRQWPSTGQAGSASAEPSCCPGGNELTVTPGEEGHQRIHMQRKPDPPWRALPHTITQTRRR